jgi:Flp pilus assembly pilin Flp
MRRHLFIRLGRDERGATLLEFGLVLLPLCLVLMGFFDLGYQSYLRSTLQGALNDVSRAASVENPVIDAEGDTLAEQIENEIRARLPGPAQDADIDIVTSNFYRASNIGNPEPLVTDVDGDGRYDSGDCWTDINPNSAFDLDSSRTGMGGADDIVFYEVTITQPRIMPMAGLLGVSDEYEITATAAVRSQPFAAQAAPATRC